VRTPARFPRPVDDEATAPVQQLTPQWNWRGYLVGIAMAALTGLAGIIGAHFGLATHDEVKGSESRIMDKLEDMVEDNRIAHSAIWSRINQREQQGETFEAAKPARTRKARDREK
jgi:hypothetical protein